MTNGTAGLAGGLRGVRLALALLPLSTSPAWPIPLHAQVLDDADVERVVETARTLPWGVSCQAWAAARDGRCAPPPLLGLRERPADVWCRIGSSPDRPGTTFFHLPRPVPDPPRCGLVQYVWRITAAADSADALVRDLEARLTGWLGPPERPPVEELGPSARHFWEGVRRWRSDERDIFLYSESARPPRRQVTLRAHTRSYGERRTAARAASRRLPTPFPDADSLIHALLPPETPGLRLLRTPVDTATAPRASTDAIGLLLDARPGEPERAAARLLLAERLLGRVADWASWTFRQRERVDAVEAELEELGLGLSWSPLGAAYSSGGLLLRRVWQGFPDTEAGRAAFGELQWRGWHTSGTCAEGTDRFRETIERGEAFLRERPDSPILAGVAFTLGRAYETWWSLGLADRDPRGFDPSDYADGGEAARAAAIRWYEEALAAGLSHPDLEHHARSRIALLTLGHDTQSRAYYCHYD